MVSESASRSWRPIVLGALLFVIGGWLVLIGKAAEGPQAKSDPGSQLAPFEALDREFLSAYAKARTDVLQHQGPIILADSDTLTLRDGSKRETVQTSPPALLPLKAVAHAPLALFAVVSVADQDRLEPAQFETLRRLTDAMDRAIQALPRSDLSAEQRNRAGMILERCRTWAAAVRDQAKLSRQEFQNLVDQLRPAILASARDAARLRIDACHAAVTRWKRQLAPEEWGRLRVIVIGSQMPRKENLLVQYFARLLGEPGESKRIIYAESIYEEPRALNLLGTHLLDSAAAQAFFGDPHRLDSDLLGPAAREYLNTLFP